MEKLRYPLLYFQLQEDLLLGMLVGTPFQALESNLAALKATLTDYLQREYKKHNDYPFADILEPKLLMTGVNIRPTYRDQSGLYPSGEKLHLSIPVVYGPTAEGHFLCHLPLLEGLFYYYEAGQLAPLVQHFCTSYFDQAQPEQVFSMMSYPKPALDIITLKVNYNRSVSWGNFTHNRPLNVLNRLAEPYPAPKQRRKALSIAPEAAWQLEDKVEEVFDKLTNARSNVVIIGAPGVGKSAVLRQAVKKWRQQNKTTGCWRMTAERITAGSKYLGEWEETCESLVDELQAHNGVLWIDDLPRLQHIGGESPEVSVAAFLTPFLQQQRLRLIGEATPQEWDRLRRKLPAFALCFHAVHVPELPIPEVRKVLQQLADYVHASRKIQLEPRAIDTAFQLLNRFFPHERFPGKAVTFLGQCVSDAIAAKRSHIKPRDVIAQFVNQSGMPELFLRDDLHLDQEALRAFFYSRIIGQPAVTDQLCNLVKIFKAGLNNPHKPIATLLFAGPTGVGKTASAKALADYFFGAGQRRSPLIRIDMSEFQSPHQIQRLLGDGARAGQLVKEIRERPFAVLLLDEVEKAHPLIFDILLNLLDEGMLTDFYGRSVNFRNTIIIMTSNLGASERPTIAFQKDPLDTSKYLSAIEDFFRPEFVNRIDHILYFQPLAEAEIGLIARKELEELPLREGFSKRGLTLQFSEPLVAHLVQIGFDARYGARPLQRAIEQIVVNPLARWLLEYPEAAATTLLVDYEDGQVRVRGREGEREGGREKFEVV